MKLLVSALAAAAALGATTAAHATDVGVSIGISQPGVYGRIDIGSFPQPAIILTQPVIIQRPVVVQSVQPVYLWVPPGHRKKWSKHCAEYNACGTPVYFVDNAWYQDNVMYGNHGKGNGKGKGKGKD
jgi:hypothetical protein